MAAAIARKAGARYVVITDVNEYRLDLALKMGATHALNVQKENVPALIEKLGIEYGFTVGLEMSGHPSGLNTLLENLRHGGRIALLGILPPGTVIDWDLVIFKMLELKGIYGREIFSTWYQMVHLIQSGLDLSPIITHQFAIDDFDRAFKTMLTGQTGKVILNWS